MARRALGFIFLLLQATAWALRNVQDPQLFREGSCTPPGAFRQEMHNVADVQYHITIRIGGQPVQGILDTGSFDLVAFAKRCHSCGTAGAYDKLRSAHFRRGNSSGRHAYGSGTCNTEDGRDTVELGCYSSADQGFWEAVECNMPLLLAASFHAIVGIGPPGQPEFTARMKIAEATKLEAELTKKGLPVGQELKDILDDAKIELEEALKKKSLLQTFGISAFSTCLGRASGSSAVMVWNDETREGRPGVTKVPVIGNITWGIQLQDVGLIYHNGDHVMIGCEKGCGAVIDTGTSLFGVPSHVYEGAAKAVRGASPSLDCTDLGSFPDLTFKVDGHRVRFPPSSYLGSTFGILSAQAERFIHSNPNNSYEQAICQLLLMDLGEEMTQVGPMFILGMPFFREYYTTFSLGKGRGDRSIFISSAGDNCEPDLGARTKAFATSRHVEAKRLDASKLLTPSWLHGDRDRFEI